MAKQTVPLLLLPKNWPRRVRSAAVHAIALARLALTTARGQANSTAPGSGRIARLTEEIFLIKEEMRIKDARMKGIPAQRRGRTFTCWNNEPFTAHVDQHTGGASGTFVVGATKGVGERSGTVEGVESPRDGLETWRRIDSRALSNSLDEYSRVALQTSSSLPNHQRFDSVRSSPLAAIH